HLLMLVVRRDTSLEVGNAELACDGLGGARVVAGKHDDVDAKLAQFRERLRRGGLHGVGDRENSCGSAVDGDEDGSRTFGLMGSAEGFKRGGVNNSVLPPEVCLADSQPA